MIKKNQYLMVFDVGTGAIRCSIIDLKGRCISSTYKEHSYNVPKGFPGGLEFNPSIFWNTLCSLSKQSMKKGGIKSEKIIAVTSTSQREGIVLLDKSGKELYGGPNIDFRATEEEREIDRFFGEKIYRISGRWPSSMFTPCRLEWFRRHKPKTFDKISHLLMINDWVLYKLSGELYSEPTNACETALFDINKLTWSQELLKSLKLPSSIFPEIRFPGTQIGTVMKSVVEDTGLKQGTPVIIGAADTQCGLLGNGVYKDGQIGVIAGTTTPVQMVISYPFIDPKWRMWTNYYILPNKWVLESNANDTGIIHRWFRDSFYQSAKQTNENHKDNIYELMTQEAEKVEPGTNPIFAFLGSEIWNAREKHYKLGGFFLPLPIRRVYERKYFTRSILESMAYAIMGNIEQIREVMPKRITELFVGGGGSKCNMWLKILANVTNLKILSPKIAESSSIGAAICAARGIGIYPDFKSAVKNMVHLKDPIIPDNKISQRYNESYKQWKNLYDKLLVFNSVK